MKRIAPYLASVSIALTFAPLVTFHPANGRTAKDARAAPAMNAAEAAVEAAEAAANESYEADAVDAAAAAAASGFDSSNTGDIAQPYGKAWAGNPDGDVTLVVFADYGCPACREAQAVTDRLIAEDPHLRVVYRLIVLDNYPGKTAAQASLTLAMSEVEVDWHKFHRALMERNATSSKAITAIAREQGIAETVLNGSLLSKSAQPDEEISSNDAALAYGGGTSLPAWAVGTGKVTMGHSHSAIKAAIARSRNDEARLK